MREDGRWKMYGIRWLASESGLGSLTLEYLFPGRYKDRTKMYLETATAATTATAGVIEPMTDGGFGLRLAGGRGGGEIEG